uniref:Serine protease hepsin n=2 Tax=Cacopsylla melanoneura TaxID=428564 RepID=A0A8D8RJE1_9HEMI
MFYLNIFLVYLLSSVSALLPGDTRFNPHCEIPALDQVDVEIDMLGDREKNNICSLPRPTDLCPKGKGPADEFCKKIARAAGGTSNAKCLRKRTCSFQVNKPFRHPSRPGAAYVSLCKGKRDGVIFPCRENNLNIVDPDYNDFEEEEEDEAPVASPNWTPLGINRCGIVDESIKAFKITATKVVGGEPTERGQFPWQVALYRKRVDGENEDWFKLFCGGSIISKQHILTAAHCFKDFEYHSYKVIVGDFNRMVTEPEEQEFPFSANEIYAHPNYKKLTDENDIAIIKLKGSIKMGKYAQPICLPANTLKYEDKLNCVVSGWGKTRDVESADNSLELRAARVQTLPYEDCRKEESYGNKIKDSMFCAGSFKGGADSCQGDSGGPIVCDVQDFDKHILIQYGIVSFGSALGCGYVNKPGVYTRLSEYQDWIDQTLKESIKTIAHVVKKKTGPNDEK